MFLNSGVPPEKSVISAQTILLSKELEKRGHDIKVFSYGKSLRLNNYQTQGLEPKLRKILHPRMLRMYIRDFDILHLHYFNWAPTNYIPLIKPFLGKPLVGTGYGSDIRSLPMILKKRIRLKYILKVLDYLFVHDPDLEMISRNFGCKNVISIPNLIDSEVFSPNYRSKRFSHLKKNKTVLFNARLVSLKDPITFIHSIPLVLMDEPDTLFLVSGDGPLFNKCQHLIKKLNLKNNVRLLGWIPHRYLPDLVSISDVSIHLSATKNYPVIWNVSLLEAMSAGKATVITEDEYSRNYVENFEITEFVGHRQPKQLAKAIIRLLSDKNLRYRLGKNARYFANNNFSKEVVAQKIEEIYQLLL